MRKELSKINGTRTSFTGTFERFGTKSNYKGPPSKTILLKDIKRLSGEIVADHLWFIVGKRFDAANLTEGDTIKFDARVTPYIKGYKGYRDDFFDAPIEKDYRLSYPTNIRKIEPQTCINHEQMI